MPVAEGRFFTQGVEAMQALILSGSHTLAHYEIDMGRSGVASVVSPYLWQYGLNPLIHACGPSRLNSWCFSSEIVLAMHPGPHLGVVSVGGLMIGETLAVAGTLLLDGAPCLAVAKTSGADLPQSLPAPTCRPESE